MGKVVIVPIAILLLAILVNAQNVARWSSWSEKETEKILNDSPWGQTQIETNTSEMTYSPTSGGSSGMGGRNTPNSAATMRGEQSTNNQNRSVEGAYNRAVSVAYHIRFLSARPIREAIAHSALQKCIADVKGDETKILKCRSELLSFVERDFRDYIVVTVAYEADDQRLAGKTFQDLSSAILATVKNTSYLERKDGKRIFPIDYRAPVEDGLGARFVFPRFVDGKAFLKEDSGDVRFYAEVGATVKLNQHFKVTNMMYAGKLEY